MIYSVHGTLAVLEPRDGVYYAVVETSGGVAYEMKTTDTTAGQCLKVGELVTLLTHFSVREGAVDLYGFFHREERRFFQMLISVSGIGPRVALSILSSVTPSQLALCIASGDSKALVACKGIGNKTAQRVVLELKDKVGAQEMQSDKSLGAISVPSTGSAISGAASEAVSALVVLGYSRAESVAAVGKVKDGSSVEEFIKGALKLLASRK